MANVYLQDSTLTNIGDAIREKTGKSDLLLPSEMPSAIQSITTGGGQTGATTWTPEPDWWDIKTILENDTETYGQQKVIFLLTDQLDDKATTNIIKGFQYYKTSDGQVFNRDNTTEDFDISNIFDTTKDKECSKGYKTRYIIGYINSESILNISLPLNAIYIIASNIRYNCVFESKYYLQAIEHINNAKLATASFTSFQKMFFRCYSLQSIPEIDTSKGTNFSSMFYLCRSLQSIPKLNTSNGTDFSSMFYYCESLKSIPEIDTSKGTNFNQMFSTCFSLQSIPRLNTSKGVSFRGIFEYCYSLQSIPKLNTSNGTDFTKFFYNCVVLKSIPEIDTSNGTVFVGMFEYCYLLQSIPEIDTSKGTSLTQMFSNCYMLQSIPKLNTSKSSSYSNIFHNCNMLTEIGILGNIKVNFAINESSYVQHSTLIKILNALIDNTGNTTSLKLTLGSTNLAKLTAEEKAIATNKNWTLA